VALSRYSSHIHRDLGFFPAVSQVNLTALAYEFARHEHYGHLSTVRAWTFLYNPKDCSDYLNVINETVNSVYLIFKDNTSGNN